MTAPLTKDDVETRPEEIYQVPGDHEKLSHYYDTRLYDALESSLTGTPIPMLCGLVMIPQRDPKFPVCPECQEIVNYRSVD